MSKICHIRSITVDDIRTHRETVLKSKESSVKFLKSAGIIDKNGKIANAYSEKYNKLSYRNSK